MVQFNRRQWLQFVLGLTIASSYGVIEKSTIKALEVGKTTIEIRAWTPEGKPLDKKSLSQLYFLDLNDEPVFTNPEIVEAGKFIIHPPAFPFAIALRFSVAGFGKVTLYADNKAKGYTSADFPLNLNLAFAISRLHRVTTYLKHHRQRGINFPKSVDDRYLQRCLAAEIPFEIIGLQVYYPNQDMFEINRLLERFSSLNKPIHITELGVSSAATIDENSQLKEPRGLWHKPWNEAIQADWIEQFYTLCYSKPYIEAISWWDLADGGNFWPHGGLLNPKMQPKLAYHRLNRLINKWNINRN